MREMDVGRSDPSHNLTAFARTDSDLLFTVSQKLDAACNKIRSLPDELSSLVNLRELLMYSNQLSEPPVTILSHLTALEIIDLHGNFRQEGTEVEVLRIPSPLLPILHPGLVKLDLRQWRPRCVPVIPDDISMYHLLCVHAEVARRTPVPQVAFYL